MWSNVLCSTLLFPMHCQQLQVFGISMCTGARRLAAYGKSLLAHLPNIIAMQICTEAWRKAGPHSFKAQLANCRHCGLGWRTGAWRRRRRACWWAARRSPGSCPGPQSAAQPSSPRLLMAQEKTQAAHHWPVSCSVIVRCEGLACKPSHLQLKQQGDWDTSAPQVSSAAHRTSFCRCCSSYTMQQARGSGAHHPTIVKAQDKLTTLE